MLAELLQNVEKLVPQIGVINHQKNKKMEKDKKFEPHMMYCGKKGKPFKANTYKEHMALKKKGCGHKKPK